MSAKIHTLENVVCLCHLLHILLTPLTNVCEEANVVDPDHQSGPNCLTETLLKDFSSRFKL